MLVAPLTSGWCAFAFCIDGRNADLHAEWTPPCMANLHVIIKPCAHHPAFTFLNADLISSVEAELLTPRTSYKPSATDVLKVALQHFDANGSLCVASMGGGLLYHHERYGELTGVCCNAHTSQTSKLAGS